MWVATAVVATSSIYSAIEADKAKDEAKEQAKKDAARAREAEQFAKQDGAGIGQFGTIDMSVDETLDDDIRKSGSSNLSI